MIGSPGSGDWQCDVYVYTANPPIVLPYRLDAPKNVPNLKIVWHLIDPDAFFEASDGPLWTKPSSPAEFTDVGPVNSPSDPASSAKANKYRITYKNTVASQEHPYVIKFKKPNALDSRLSDEFSCDPNITNSGN